MSLLAQFFAEETATPAPAAVASFARELAVRSNAAVVLFYGSALRTGELDGVLDYYVLTPGPHRRGVRGWVERRLWPEIRFETHLVEGVELRAKVAVMPLAVFATAAKGDLVDTTVWTRFVQPSRLLWVADEAARTRVLDALAAAAVTAARFALAIGPGRGPASTYWAGLFQETYAAELRVEPPGRERQVIDAAADRYARLLPMAWAAAGIAFDEDGAELVPCAPASAAAAWRRAWRLRRRWGKPLNASRLLKAALTAPGAAAYAAGKLARHTDVAVEVTPWRERHPVLAALPVLWRLRRRRRQADAR